MSPSRNVLTIVAISTLFISANSLAGGANSNGAVVTQISCPGYDTAPGAKKSINDGLTCFDVKGFSKGNHEIDCTVIVPDNLHRGKGSTPLIAWANGWDQGNVLGQCTTNGYLFGLKKWAKSGYVVAATNAWSVQESDVLACAQWVSDNRGKNGIAAIDPDLIGIVGHSQGGGAVIKAGSGNKSIDIKAVLAMNPYGPGWVSPENQTGQVLIVGGRNDTTTPPESYAAVSDAIIQQANPGGINAVALLGTHNVDAWGTYDEAGTLTMSCEDAAKEDFGRYQNVGYLWWQANLREDAGAMDVLESILCDPTEWETPQHAGVEGFDGCD